MMIFQWVKIAWLWLRNTLVYFLTRLKGSKHDHDSDDSSIEDDAPCTVPCESGNGIFDEVDHAPKSRDQNMRRAYITDVPTRRGPNFPGPNRKPSHGVRLENPYCIVIVNIFFENKIGARNGAQADKENIERLLETAGFTSCRVHCDKNRTETLELIEKAANSPQMAEHDGLVVFISSHGKAKGILTVDKKIIEVEELTSRVNGNQCPSLRGKPKLFFISACRGRKSDRGVPGVIDSDAGVNERVVPRLPTDADFLVCYSTTKDNVSHRRFTLQPVENSRDMGTWLISSLTQVFTERMRHEDVMQMLARVNSRVADMATRNDHVNGMKQMPVQMHMLRHPVFFGRI